MDGRTAAKAQRQRRIEALDERARLVERLRFLDVVAAAEPRVLESLSALIPQAEDIQTAVNEGEIPDPLRQWARAFRLDEEWVIELAIQQIEGWRDAPDLASPALEWSGLGGAIPTLTREEARLNLGELPQWQPFLETGRSYRQRVERLIQNRFNAEMARLQRIVKERGFDVPRKGVAHLEWLARYQVLGLSYSRIAESASGVADRKTIEGAVKDTAQLIGLTLRPGDKGGRPRTRT